MAVFYENGEHINILPLFICLHQRMQWLLSYINMQFIPVYIYAYMISRYKR